MYVRGKRLQKGSTHSSSRALCGLRQPSVDVVVVFALTRSFYATTSIRRTPSVRPDSSSSTDTNYVVTD